MRFTGCDTRIVRHRGGGRWSGAVTLLLLLAACEQQLPPPPPPLSFDGLPISGSLKDAMRMGLDECFQTDVTRMRCRRHGVIVEKQGPYEAAVDLAGGDGRGGFDQLILWQDRDQYGVYALADEFERQGWHYCYTNRNGIGDQVIYTLKGAAFRVSMDLSYYSKRRLRLIPNWNRDEQRCSPEAFKKNNYR